MRFLTILLSCAAVLASPLSPHRSSSSSSHSSVLPPSFDRSLLSLSSSSSLLLSSVSSLSSSSSSSAPYFSSDFIHDIQMIDEPSMLEAEPNAHHQDDNRKHELSYKLRNAPFQCEAVHSLLSTVIAQTSIQAQQSRAHAHAHAHVEAARDEDEHNNQVDPEVLSALIVTSTAANACSLSCYNALKYGAQTDSDHDARWKECKTAAVDTVSWALITATLAKKDGAAVPRVHPAPSK